MSTNAAVVWSGTLTLPGLLPFAAAAEAVDRADASSAIAPGTGWDIVPQAVVHMGRTDGPALSRCALRSVSFRNHRKRNCAPLASTVCTELMAMNILSAVQPPPESRQQEHEVGCQCRAGLRERRPRTQYAAFRCHVAPSAGGLSTCESSYEPVALVFRQVHAPPGAATRRARR